MRLFEFVCFTSLALATAAPALAQATGAGTSASGSVSSEPNIGGGSEGDNGAGLADEAKAWIGAEVKTSDDVTLGTLKEVVSVSDTSDSGELIITPGDAGAEEIRAPLQGASFTDGIVTVTPTSDRIEK